MRCVIYARFSSDRQTEMSIDAQVRACTEYATKHSMNIIEIYKDEAISGTTNQRPRYQSMLSDAFDSRFDVILIHKYDRIARDLSEQVNLRDKLKQLNIKLIAVAQDYGEGKDANLSKGIQWVLGEYYSANLSEEVKKGHKEIALKGMHNGGLPPFGYNVENQRYVINELEANYVRTMFETCISGGSYSNIIKSLSDTGIVGKRGKPIKYSQIYEILHNEKYTGTYVYSLTEESDRHERRSKPNAIRVDNAFPAIISKEIYQQAQLVLESRKNSGNQKHPCSGLVYCAECRSKMHLSRTERRGHKYNNFRCCNKCGAPGVPVEFVDEAVNKYIAELFNDQNMVQIEAAILELTKYNRSNEKQFEQEKAKKIAKLESEIKNIMDGLASGAFKDNYDLCNQLLNNHRKEIENLKVSKYSGIPEGTVRKWITNIVSKNYAPGVFIERIEAKTTQIIIHSNFDRVVSNLGCGGTVDSIPTTLPSILWSGLFYT